MACASDLDRMSLHRMLYYARQRIDAALVRVYGACGEGVLLRFVHDDDPADDLYGRDCRGVISACLESVFFRQKNTRPMIRREIGRGKSFFLVYETAKKVDLKKI